MPYSAISAKRMPYDIDGTIIGFNYSNDYANGITTFFDQSQLTELNNTTETNVLQAPDTGICAYVMFPEKRIIKGLYVSIRCWNNLYGYISWGGLQGSIDTTNGADGSWTDITVDGYTTEPATTSWRTGIKTVTDATSYKAIRFKLSRSNGYPILVSLHVYGDKGTGESPNDLLFTDASGVELTTLKDFGDKARGTTTSDTIYIKNSSTLTANAVTIDVEGTGYTTSLDNVTFDTTQKSLGNLATGAVSAPVYVKFAPSSSATVGPSQGRVKANCTSFS